MAAGLAVGHLVGGFISSSASPFFAVGGSAIDLTPLWLKDFAVRTFGTYDKAVLLSSMAVVIGLVGGLLSRRSRTPGLVLIVVLGVVAGVAVLSRPTAGPLDVFAPLLVLIASVGVFTALHCLALLSQRPAGDGAAEVSRRALLAESAAVAAGAGIVAACGQLLAGGSGIEASRKAVGRIVPTVPAPLIPPIVDFSADESPTFITPNQSFYRIDVNLTLPQLRAEDWWLRVHGMVERGSST